MELSTNTEPIKRADEIEELLLQEIRRLGNATMEGWAGGVEKTLGQQLKQKDPSAVERKKTLAWWCVFGSVKVSERVWQLEQQKYVHLLPQAIGVRPRGRSRRLDRLTNLETRS